MRRCVPMLVLVIRQINSNQILGFGPLLASGSAISFILNNSSSSWSACLFFFVCLFIFVYVQIINGGAHQGTGVYHRFLPMTL